MIPIKELENHLQCSEPCFHSICSHNVGSEDQNELIYSILSWVRISTKTHSYLQKKNEILIGQIKNLTLETSYLILIYSLYNYLITLMSKLFLFCVFFLLYCKSVISLIKQ